MDITTVFVDEIYSNPLEKISYEKKLYSLFDELWSIGLSDLNEY